MSDSVVRAILLRANDLVQSNNSEPAPSNDSQTIDTSLAHRNEQAPINRTWVSYLG